MTNVVRHFDVTTLRKTEPRSLLPGVAAQFVADLERATLLPPPGKGGSQ
jgi:hypothetical protein